jgi:hypothetical protein
MAVQPRRRPEPQHPDPTPIVRNVYFRHREIRGFSLEALRDADAPPPTRLVTECDMRAKGMDRSDPGIWGSCRELVRSALARLVARGMVWKIVSEPEAWWGLVGAYCEPDEDLPKTYARDAATND